MSCPSLSPGAVPSPINSLSVNYNASSAQGIAVLGGVTAINRLVPPVPTYYQPTIQEFRQPHSAPVVPPSPSPSTPTH
ncbi:hypothetical protein [Candidatus Magnetaquicoccus inordinatus]|uniref:hypothetical protein n=1 Tax=Candidatus Magnetaquicoccus inordinatus TaxID=2496818 RepID=UPI00102AAAF2|nr:hypothetical protein [Candidatus Magnetaquicoccus inordinatus]